MNNRNSDSSRRWLSAVVTLVGLWVIALPFVYQVTETALWNNVIVGAAIVALGAYNFYELSDRGTINVGSAGLAVLLGLWLIAAPFLLEFGSESVFWSTVASGVVVALLSGYNAYRGQNTETTTGTETRT